MLIRASFSSRVSRDSPAYWPESVNTREQKHWTQDLQHVCFWYLYEFTRTNSAVNIYTRSEPGVVATGPMMKLMLETVHWFGPLGHDSNVSFSIVQCCRVYLYDTYKETQVFLDARLI